ncbi:hypothetical protein tb265_05000 [Gemmatimonadetes bacterium T265]|nr:hypothetical protein tb265_05000 [Gemmatimonadetes bacterium T265]
MEDESAAFAPRPQLAFPPFALFETIRFTPRAGFPDGFARLDRHLDRIAASAAHFGFADPTAAAVAALRREAALLAGEPQRWRVRLTAHADGSAEVASALLPADASRVRTAALARTPVDRNDVFLHHKTTHRAVYDARRAERTHVDDVLLWNAEGELTEFTLGSLVVELGGRRWTPPRACGLLGGVFRAELLERGLVAERVLRATELAGARVWCVSSLREWVAVEMHARA